jgi:8-oxo-dGTP pyrophosphatase MutT (NUDIX family)
MAEIPHDPGVERVLRGHGVVAIARRGEHFLAIRRGPTLRAGGQVCFPGGHIESGEADHEAVVRECLEELAAPVRPVQRVWRSVTAWGTALAWWTVELEEAVTLVPDPVEVDEIFWLTLEQLASHPDLLEGNREFLSGVRSGAIRLE